MGVQIIYSIFSLGRNDVGYLYICGYLLITLTLKFLLLKITRWEYKTINDCVSVMPIDPGHRMLSNRCKVKKV